VLYALALVGLVLLPGAYRTVRHDPVASLRADIAEGMRYLFGHRLLRTLGLLLGAMNLVGSAQFAIFVLFSVTEAPDGLGLGDRGVGLLLTAGAVGGVVGSFLAAPIERAIGRTRVLAVAVVMGAVALAAPGVVARVPVAAVAGALIGLTGVMWNVVTVSLRQRIIPDALLGRVNSGYRLLGWGTIPIGAAAGGVLAEAIGLRAVFVVAGALQLLLLVPLLVVVNDQVIAAEERRAGVTTGSR
jgi:MFS family permease